MEHVTRDQLQQAIEDYNQFVTELNSSDRDDIDNDVHRELFQEIVALADGMEEDVPSDFEELLMTLITEHTKKTRTNETILAASAGFLRQCKATMKTPTYQTLESWVAGAGNYGDQSHSTLYSRIVVRRALLAHRLIQNRRQEGQGNPEQELLQSTREDFRHKLRTSYQKIASQINIPSTSNFTPSLQPETETNLTRPTQLPRDITPTRTTTTIPHVTPRLYPNTSTGTTDVQFRQLANEMLKLTNLVASVATAMKPNKNITVPKFTGKADEVESFISSVITAYAANDWNDDVNDPSTLSVGRRATREELFATSFSQVNKVALHFQGSAAIWWQNLQNKPLTLHHRQAILSRTETDTTPGWGYVSEADGLIDMLRKKFKSLTHIADANTKIAKMHFDPKGVEDIRSFAARLDALLITTGRTHSYDEQVINGTRAEALFRALPQWLEQRIREQGIPPECTHEQWCFGQVLAMASRITAASKTRQTRETYTPSSKTPTATPATEPTTTTAFSKHKKLSEMTAKERADLIANNICLFCRKKGHTRDECTTLKKVKTLKKDESQTKGEANLVQTNDTDYVTVIENNRRTPPSSHRKRTPPRNADDNANHPRDQKKYRPAFTYNEYGYRYPTQEEQAQRYEKYFKRSRCPCGTPWYSPTDYCSSCVLQLISRADDDKNFLTVLDDPSPPQQQPSKNPIDPDKQLKVQKLHPNAKLPFHATPGAAGYDVYAIEDMKVPPQRAKKVGTGIALTCPPGTYGKISPTSGLMTKGLVVMDGTIDADYTGEIIVCLENRTDKEYTVNKHQKIAQIIFVECRIGLHVTEVQELKSTTRGADGFGSTDHLNTQSTVEEIWTLEPSDLIKIPGIIKQKKIDVLIDSGASGNYLSKTLAEKANIVLTPSQARNVVMANGSKIRVDSKASNLPLIMGQYTDKLDFDIITSTHDVILGKEWLHRTNPYIDWRTHELTLKHKGKMMTLKPEPTENTEFISAIQCADDIVKKKERYHLCFLKDPAYEDKIEDTDPRVQELLREYQDLFPEELPEGLPPKRSVDHHI